MGRRGKLGNGMMIGRVEKEESWMVLVSVGDRQMKGALDKSDMALSPVLFETFGNR